MVLGPGLAFGARGTVRVIDGRSLVAESGAPGTMYPIPMMLLVGPRAWGSRPRLPAPGRAAAY